MSKKEQWESYNFKLLAIRPLKGCAGSDSEIDKEIKKLQELKRKRND